MAKILGISKAAVEAAEAAESPNLKVPDNAVRKDITSGKQSGDTEFRWAERGVVKNAYSMDDPGNSDRTIFYVQLQVQPGSINKTKPIFGRHYVNYTTLLSGSEVDSFMNNKSVTALKSLVRSTGGFVGADGDIPVATLQAMFPDKAATTQKSTLLGKRVIAQMVERGAAESKNKDGDVDPEYVPFTKRFQGVESYSPDA
jgi:hypothetical protein